MSDVVSGLLAKLDEIERMTLAAKPHRQQLLWSRRAGNEKMNAYLTQVADPDDVLRLCRAHRDLIDEYQKHRQMADQLEDDPAYKDGETHLTVVGVTAGLRAAVVLVARGLGVEDKEN